MPLVIRGEQVTEFLRGDGTDHKGRTFESMLEWTDMQLEQCHDQVQWMFPIHEESKHANVYPVISKDDTFAAELYPSMRTNLLLGKDRFERFFGIGRHEDIDKQRRWCKDRDHNLLRVTRIIRCLRLFGLEGAAGSFYDNAMKAANHFGISPVTLEYWRKAKEDGVWEKLQ